MQENTDRTDGQPETLRLTCDTMLGKLSRELRKLGVDTEYRRSGGGIRGYKQARAKGRVFLTRTNRLKELDMVAYIRFACVYRRFKDVDELMQALTTASPEEIENERK